MFEKIISLVAPHYCIVCGEEGEVVCAWCLPDFAEPLPSRCYACQAVTSDSQVCHKCRRASGLKHVWVRAHYGGNAKQLVHGFKFEHKRASADPVSLLMSESLPFIAPDTILTHVPTATSRVRQRGYDQAELIAQRLSKHLGLKHDTLLMRTTQTRQVGAKRAERKEQMEKAFVFIEKKNIKGAKVLLVDDLVTTGATLESAARCLKSKGAKTVDAVIFAQR